MRFTIIYYAIMAAATIYTARLHARLSPFAGPSVGLQDFPTLHVKPLADWPANYSSSSLLQGPAVRIHGYGPATARRATIAEVIDAMIQVESGGDDNDIGDDGRAVGCLQLWPIAVRDCNRIVGRNGYGLADRLDRAKSIAMARTLLTHYCRDGSAEDMARRWVGGTYYQHTLKADEYWAKVKKEMRCVKCI